MTNHDVFEAFVAGEDADVNNVRSERTATGHMVLYSYATPIAWHNGRTVYVDGRKYSVTTSKHTTGTVMPAHRAGMGWERVDHETFRAAVTAAGANVRRAR